jgi:cysteine desulfurase
MQVQKVFIDIFVFQNRGKDRNTMSDFSSYYDYNATTPLHPEVLEAMLPWMKESFGNASSMHSRGRKASRAVEQAKEKTAAFLKAHPEEIFFTSGSTESVNLVLRGFSEQYLRPGDLILSHAAEHKAVLDTLNYLKEKKFNIRIESPAVWENETWKEMCDASFPKMIALMQVNNETGTMYPVEEVANECEEKGIFFFTDATQAVGKIPVDVQNVPVHALAFSAHKMYGPQGIGVVYLRRSQKKRIILKPQITGGGHQDGIRAGTLPVALIVGMGACCQFAMKEMIKQEQKIKKKRDLFEQLIKKEIPDAEIVEEHKKRIYNTSMIVFPGPLQNLSGLWEKYAFSTGAACSSEKKEPSHVLKALGYPKEKIANAYRFSFGMYNTDENIHQLVRDLRNSLEKK